MDSGARSDNYYVTQILDPVTVNRKRKFIDDEQQTESSVNERLLMLEEEVRNILTKFTKKQPKKKKDTLLDLDVKLTFILNMLNKLVERSLKPHDG